MRGLPTAKTPKSKRVKTVTFGCKVNLTDSIRLQTLLERGGQYVSCNDTAQDPDLVVINTCSVTANADRDARRAVRKMNREHPNAKILVTGCYAGARENRLSEMEGVWKVIPVEEQGEIPELLGLDIPKEEMTLDIERFGDRTRAFMKLQDGCNAYCSFCILPYVRGRSRSYTLSQLQEQAKVYEENGYREIVITGTHVGAYGRDLQPRKKLSHAIEAILEATATTRIRLSSLEPTTLTSDVIRLVRDEERLQPHFHIPLQSGSDRVLRRMNRKCPSKKYRERVESLASARDHIAIGADVIVGFPGETEAEFEETRSLIESLPITYLHVFPYSSRPGTRAETYEDNVPPELKKERSKVLRDLGQKKRRDFEARFKGRSVPILAEHRRTRDGRLTGISPHYIRASFEGHDRLMGREVDVFLEKPTRTGYVGRVQTRPTNSLEELFTREIGDVRP